MATLALPTDCALRKLSSVRIRLVAVCAEIVRNGRFEISIRVALHASDLLMLSLQSKVRLRVIELSCKCRFLPCHRLMAGITFLFERALMRIDTVAVSAIRKRQPRVPGLSILHQCMATLAYNAAMFVGQREARLGVVEPFLAHASGLPIRGGVALRAILSKPFLVPVVMTRSATRRKPHPCGSDPCSSAASAPAQCPW